MSWASVGGSKLSRAIAVKRSSLRDLAALPYDGLAALVGASGQRYLSLFYS